VNLPPREADLPGEAYALQRQLERFLAALLFRREIREHAEGHRLARRGAVAPVDREALVRQRPCSGVISAPRGLDRQAVKQVRRRELVAELPECLQALLV